MLLGLEGDLHPNVHNNVLAIFVYYHVLLNPFIVWSEIIMIVCLYDKCAILACWLYMSQTCWKFDLTHLYRYWSTIWKSLAWCVNKRLIATGLRADLPENFHLNVKKLPKTWHFFKKEHFGHFFWKKVKLFAIFYTQMAIFGRFRHRVRKICEF